MIKLTGRIHAYRAPEHCADSEAFPPVAFIVQLVHRFLSLLRGLVLDERVHLIAHQRVCV